MTVMDVIRANPVARIAVPVTTNTLYRPSREMSLPDMVQVLFHGRKGGNLRIRAREGTGEIHFADGDVVNALWGELRGEDAFFAMLRLKAVG